MGNIADLAAQQGIGVATNAANGAVGAIMGLALEHHNDKRQINQQTKLQNLQIAGNKQMVDYNYAKELQMWKDTNYSAQMDELKKAGLNPGLLYGMSGGGGTTVGQATGSVSGAEAPKGGNEIATQQAMGIQNAQSAMQLSLLQAQKENIEADTRNKEADTTNKPKVGANLEASTGKLLADTGNVEADTALKKIEAKIAEINRDFQNASFSERLETIHQQERLLTGQASQALIQANVDEQTRKTKEELIRQELVMNTVTMELQKSQIGKNSAEVQQLAKQITLAYAQLANQKDQTEIQKKLQEFQTSFGGQASNVLGQLLQFIPGKRKAN